MDMAPLDDQYSPDVYYTYDINQYLLVFHKRRVVYYSKLCFVSQGCRRMATGDPNADKQGRKYDLNYLLKKKGLQVGRQAGMGAV